jgi:ribosomal protein S12
MYVELLEVADGSKDEVTLSGFRGNRDIPGVHFQVVKVFKHSLKKLRDRYRSDI